MDPVFAWIEHSALSDWIRGSDCVCAFPAIVTLHNIGMAFLAGCGIAIDLRIIGFAQGIPIKPMARLLPLMWAAFAPVVMIAGVLDWIIYALLTFHIVPAMEALVRIVLGFFLFPVVAWIVLIPTHRTLPAG